MDYPSTWEYCNIYPLADLHIGDPNADEAEIWKRIKKAQEDPYGLVILNGDLMNTATRGGVSDVYGEVMSPMQQIDCLCKMFAPLKDKIIGVTSGNHESRAYKDDGIDITRLVCRELGIEDRYCAEGVVVFLRFGQRCGHTRHKDRSNKQMYTIYATHGAGGGAKEGAKANRLADLACIVDADVYIHAHTHLPLVMKNSFHRVNPFASTITKTDRLFVNCGAALEYGGYGQAKGFKPASTANPVIRLEAKEKYMTATL